MAGGVLPRLHRLKTRYRLLVVGVEIRVRGDHAKRAMVPLREHREQGLKPCLCGWVWVDVLAASSRPSRFGSLYHKTLPRD